MLRNMLLATLILLAFFAPRGFAENTEPAGTTLYVSKLGNHTDGLSWSTAYNTIQAALEAVPDARGGHRIIVRPDTYMENMLTPRHKGAQGRYNELIGDVDGKYGSGTTGWSVLDCGDPDKGFKSYDWFGPIRSNEQGWSKDHTDPTFSAIDWDRWKLSSLYVTGGDAGLFWDLTDQVKPFSVIVEDSVGIGRAFGGGLAHALPRAGEPVIFRRCNLWALDWWGDTAGAYVRFENETMPETPDILFEGCTMVSPQCALKMGNFGFTTSTRVRLDGCTLAALNFSQPQGTPIDGAIQSVEQGKYVHVELHDTTVMGYKVLGVRVNKETVNEMQYTVTGNCAAYVQFQQEVPKGFYRLQQWPVDLFQTLSPPAIARPAAARYGERKIVQRDLCELSSVVWKEKLSHMACIRPASGGNKEDYYLELRDAASGEVLAKFAEGYGLASAFVHDGTFYAFASRFEDGNWNDVTCFWSKDLKQWEQKVVIEQENEHLFNSSVCAGPEGFVLAYESNDPAYPAFTTKFAQSPDLQHWTKLPEATFGTDRYTACPWIHHANGYYYVLYLENRKPRHYFETYITRSADLKHWELSSANPVLSPLGLDEGINASDPDLVEFEGQTLLHYAVGDQLTWMNIKQTTWPGTLADFLASWYAAPGIPDHGSVSAPAPDRTAWFRDAKFGIFVHWGTYALHGKNDKGAYSCLVLRDEAIPPAEYEAYAEQFTAEEFAANAWLALMQRAGARYLTFTSKHHDGFSMFDSKLTDYDSADRAAKKDFVKELIYAAQPFGIKVSLYYSMLDWRQPDFAADLPKYVNDYLFGQVRELCTNYGPIAGIWFDGEWDHPESTWRAEELVKLIHELQPAALVNDRLGKGVRGETTLADFYTREQPSEINEVMAFEGAQARPWEACMTIGESWGYNKHDTKQKSSAELIRMLVDVVSRGGNLLLNLDPTPEGTIMEVQAERLRDIGAWLDVHGEAIYGTRSLPALKIDGAKATVKGSRLYLHVEENSGQIAGLKGLENHVSRAWFLETGEEVAWNAQDGVITVPKTLPDPVVSTIVLELDGPARVRAAK
ncbi:MAG: alpha-L-fucosidase [Candidatus Hydrogenedentes bacterium]|nr:alpha-L-fucosidase [Candidatus Hydrogenedentota bacterium]